jgi:hypothetical protein
MSKAAAFAAGLGTGIITMDERMRQQDRQDRLDRMAQETHDLQVTQARRQQDEQIALANAAQPASVNEGAGGYTKPDTADNRDVGQPGEPGGEGGPTLAQGVTVNGQAYPTSAAGKAAADTYNSDDATNKRISLAYRQAGDPLAALNYGAKAVQAKSTAQDYADKQWKQQLGQAIAGGHASIADFISNHQGDQLAQYKVKAVPSEDGKNVTYNKVNDDGSLTPIPNLSFSNDEEGAVRAGYMLDKFVDPTTRYTNMIAEEKTQAGMKAKTQELELRQRMLEEVQIPNAETRQQLADVKSQLADLKAKGGDSGVSREERMKYTTLFTDAGRRMQDAQKALNTIRGDRAFMKRAGTPGSPEAQQLQDAQDQYKQYGQEREMYRSLLSNTVPGATKPAGAASAPAAAPGAPVKVGSQAERDALPAGTKYTAPDGNTYIKQ